MEVVDLRAVVSDVPVMRILADAHLARSTEGPVVSSGIHGTAAFVGHAERSAGQPSGIGSRRMRSGAASAHLDGGHGRSPGGMLGCDWSARG